MCRECSALCCTVCNHNLVSVIIQNKTVSQKYKFFLELLSFLDFLKGPTKIFCSEEGSNFSKLCSEMEFKEFEPRFKSGLN